MKNSIKRAQSENWFSALSNRRILRKANTKYLAFAAVVTMLVSCSQDDEIIPNNDLKDKPITVTAGVSNLATRAGYEGTSVLPETFYLTVKQDAADETSQYNYTNVLMTKDADGNTYSVSDGPMLKWKDDDHESVGVNAYTTDGTTFTVQTDQSTAENVLASDLLGAVKTTDGTDVTITNGNIGITFRHLLCKLDVTFSWGGEFDSYTNKKISKVVYKGFGTSAALDRDDAAVTAGEDATTGDITAYVNGTTSEAIFTPKAAADAQIIITVNVTEGEGEAATTTQRIFTLALPENTTFEQGCRYTMDVKIGITPVVLSKVAVEDWGAHKDNVTAEEDLSEIDATAITASHLETSLKTALNTGFTDITITLSETAENDMFTAINSALRSSNATDGSVDLTISGVQTIPNCYLMGNGHFEASENTDVTQVKTITLTDATTLEMSALAYCQNLEAVYLPKVTSFGIWALYVCSKLETLVLSASGDITADFTELETSGIDLTLNKDKESAVTDGNVWMKETWKSISFVE